MTEVKSTEKDYFIREYDLDESEETVLKLYQVSEGDVSCVVWDAALTLAGYLQKRVATNPTLLKDKVVVELGAGVGLCGMVAAYYGAHAILTDTQECLELLTHNVEENKKRLPVMRAEAVELSWSKETSEKLLERFPEQVDFVLLADCVYYKESLNPLVETLKVLTQPKTTVIVCVELRESKIQLSLLKEFLQLVRTFLLIREVPRQEQHEHYQCEEIMLFECHLKQ